MNIEYVNETNTFKFQIDDKEETLPYQSAVSFKHDFNPEYAEGYNVVLFQNAYFCRENDIFQLYFNGSTNRNGWLFPAQLFFSKEFEIKHNICDIIRIAQYHLIRKFQSILIKASFAELPIFKLSDLIICVFSKSEAIDNNVDITFANELGSFAKHGYYLIQEDHTIQLSKCYPEYYIAKPNERIVIKSTDSALITEPYIKSLISKWLPTANQPLQRFVLAYQVLEHCMSLYLHEIILSTTEDYREHRLSKNDFAEKIREATGEQHLIVEIFDNCIIQNDISNTFCEASRNLFDLVNIPYKQTDLAHLLYKFRNNIVHNFRNIIHEKEAFEKTLYAFEYVVLDLIESYKPYK